MDATTYHLTLRRLTGRLPGWHVWYTNRYGVDVWCAVPAPPGATLETAVMLPGRVCAKTPAELESLCHAPSAATFRLSLDRLSGDS